MINEPIQIDSMQAKLITRIIILLLLLSVSAATSDKIPEEIILGGFSLEGHIGQGFKYSVSLAISGGGARGLATIGLLKAFEEKNIGICAVAGSSMGGIIGGLYACGYSPDELTAMVDTFDFRDIFQNAPERNTMFLAQRQDKEKHLFSIRFDRFMPILPRAFTRAQKLTTLLTNLTSRASYQSDSDFDRLQIPFRAVTTDIISGKSVIFKKGSIVDALRATMAFPLAFSPVEKNGWMLMDGGVLLPIPVEVVKEINQNSFVVAINTSSKLLSKEELTNPVIIANQVTTIMTAEKMRQQLELADYKFEPPIDQFKPTSFDLRDSIINVGYRAGLIAADSIIKLLEEKNREHVFRITALNTNEIPAELLSELTNEIIARRWDRINLVTKLTELFDKHNLFSLRAEFAESSAEQTDLSLVSYILNLRIKKSVLQSKETVKFYGNKLFSDSTLLDLINLKGGYISSAVLNKALQEIETLYHENGYDLAFVKEVNVDEISNMIEIRIDEGIIHNINVSGNEYTRDWVIRSFFPLAKGEPYSLGLGSEGLNNLYGTDLFDRVTVNLKPHRLGTIVEIGVNEKNYQQVRLGWHLDEEFDSEEFSEVINNNIFGMGMKYMLHAQYAPRRRELSFSFKADRIWSTYVSAYLKIFHKRLTRKVYDDFGDVDYARVETKDGGLIRLGQQLARLGAVTAEISIEEVEYKNETSLKTEMFGLRKLTLESVVENFDRVPFPESGSKYLIQLQFGGKFLGGDFEYSKFTSEIETFLRMEKNMNFHFKFLLGLSRSGKLPVSELFYLGGSESFLGFRKFQLSGEKMLLVSNELRFKLPQNFYFSIRHDLGEVYSFSDQIKLRNLRNGIGFNLSLNTPVGPFRLSYGRADSNEEQYYFNFGHKF